MRGKLYASQNVKSIPTCGLCGRRLGIGFYFTCHVCGRSYCYVHIPIKCTHKVSPHPEQVFLARIKSQDGA